MINTHLTKTVRGRMSYFALTASVLILFSPHFALAEDEHPCGWEVNGEPPAIPQYAEPFAWGSDATPANTNEPISNETIYRTLRWVKNTSQSEYMLDWAIADLAADRFRPGWTIWRCDRGLDRQSATGLICHGPRLSHCEESVAWKNVKHLSLESRHENQSFNTLLAVKGADETFGATLTSQANKIDEGFVLEYEVKNLYGALKIEVAWPVEVARSFDDVRNFELADSGTARSARLTTPRRPIVTSIPMLLTTPDGVTVSGNVFIYTPVASE